MVVAALAALALVIDTYASLHNQYLFFDVPIEKGVQHTDWGPLGASFVAFTVVAGLTQVALAVAGILVVFLLNRPATPLMLCTGLTGAWYQGMNLLIHRPRPTADLVKVTEHLGGYGYPSGHAAFFFTFSVLLVLCLGRRYLPPRGIAVAFAAAGLVTFDACLARIYVGAHWPSDVVAGALWGIAVGVATRRLLRLLADADSIHVARFVTGLILQRHLGVSVKY